MDQPTGLDISWLTRFIRQQLASFPIDFLPNLGVEELIVEKKLTVVDQIEFRGFNYGHFIGTMDQPPFTSSWVNYGAPYSNAGYQKDPNGWVRFVGVIKSGTVGSAAFTLPPGFRPVSAKALLTLSNGTTGRVDIGTDGTVTPVSPSNNASVVLDGLHFKAAI